MALLQYLGMPLDTAVVTRLGWKHAPYVSIQLRHCAFDLSDNQQVTRGTKGSPGRVEKRCSILPYSYTSDECFGGSMQLSFIISW